MLKIIAASAIIIAPVAAVPFFIYSIVSEPQRTLNQNIEKQIKIIGEKMLEADNEINEFKKNIQDCKDKISESKKKYFKKIKEIKELNKKLERILEKNDSETEENKKLQSQIDELLKTTEEENKKIQENNAKLYRLIIGLQKWKYYYDQLIYRQKVMSDRTEKKQ